MPSPEPMTDDYLAFGVSRQANIRFLLCEVTTAARELERRHLAGPVAAAILGQALAGVSLLSSDLGADDEVISLQLKVDGPLGGLLVDLTRAGNLRGYTEQKTLGDLDVSDDAQLDLAAAFGPQGALCILQSTSKALLAQAQFHLHPVSLQVGIARYCNESRQVPTAVQLCSHIEDGYLSCAKGMLAEKMPDGDTEAFVKVLERFHDGSLAKILPTTKRLGELKDLLGLPDLHVGEIRNLRMRCRCSPERMLQALTALSTEELREILAEQETQHVTCHFCGDSYRIGTEHVRRILQQRLEQTESRDEDGG